MNLVEVLKRIPPTSTNYGEYILFSDIFDACGRGNQDILHYQLHDLEGQGIIVIKNVFDDNDKSDIILGVRFV